MISTRAQGLPGGAQVWIVELAHLPLNIRKQTSSSPPVTHRSCVLPAHSGPLSRIQGEQCPGVQGSKAGVASGHIIFFYRSDLIFPLSLTSVLIFLNFFPSPLLLINLLWLACCSAKTHQDPNSQVSSLDILHQINSTNEP